MSSLEIVATCKLTNITLKKMSFSPNIEKYKSIVNNYLKKFNKDNSNISGFKSANELLPNFVQEELILELNNCTSEIANLIRRTILNDVSVYSLQVGLEDYKCNDLHFLIDDFKLRLEGIPINQKIAESLFKDNEYTIKLSKFNSNPIKRVKVFAKDLIIMDKNSKLIKINDFLPSMITLMGSSSFILCPESRECIGAYYEFFKIAMSEQINMQRDKNININHYLSIYNPDSKNTNCKELADNLNLDRIPDRFHLFSVKPFEVALLPSELLEVNNIKIVKGKGSENSNSFSTVSRFIYKILDQKFLYNEKDSSENKDGVSSLNFNPSHFKIGYRTYGNIEPFKIILTAIDIIISKIEEINKELLSIKKLPFYGVKINLIKNINIYILEITPSTRGIINIISKYCYLLDKTISIVTPSISHPTIKKGIIKINHKNGLKLLINSTKIIIAEFKSLKKQIEIKKNKKN